MGIKTVQDTSLTSVANAIRVKAEISGTLEFPDDFVSAIQNISTGITPTGTLTITQNGTYDVAQYANADVQTPQPSGSISITENGTVDVSQYASANVNVSSGGDSLLRSLIEGHGITNLAIPSGTTKIRSSALSGFADLESVTIPNSVTEIGDSAFRNCKGLEEVTVPEGVTTIKMNAFEYCTNLERATLPSTLQNIGTGAFNNCTKLQSLTVKATTPPTPGGNFLTSTPSTMIIYVPSGSVDAYKTAGIWRFFASNIQAIPE